MLLRTDSKGNSMSHTIATCTTMSNAIFPKPYHTFLLTKYWSSLKGGSTNFIYADTTIAAIAATTVMCIDYIGTISMEGLY